MRRRTTAAIALAATLGLARPAQAGCCDDFWSCLGAVATAGLTCEVQAIVASVQKLAQTVNNLLNTLSGKAGDVVSDATGAVTQAAADANGIANQASSDVASQAARAHVIANPNLSSANSRAGNAVVGGGSGTGGPSSGSGTGGAGRATSAAGAQSVPAAVPGGGGGGGSGGSGSPYTNVPPQTIAKVADPGAVKMALARADSYEQDLAGKQGGMRGQVSGAASGAVACMPPHVVNAQQMVTDVALTPLKLLASSLADLLSHPEHIFDPSAQIDADINQITTTVAQLFDKMTAEITTEPNGRLEAVRGVLDTMQDEAAVARSIADAMQKVQGSGTQADLDALNRLLPSGGGPSRVVSGGTVLPVAVLASTHDASSAFARAQPQNLPVATRHKGEISDIASGWTSIKGQARTPPHADPSYAPRVDAEFSKLRGRPAGEVQKQKQAWADEARRRFANDPKTLQKVLQYIDTH